MEIEDALVLPQSPRSILYLLFIVARIDCPMLFDLRELGNRLRFVVSYKLFSRDGTQASHVSCNAINDLCRLIHGAFG